MRQVPPPGETAILPPGRASASGNDTGMEDKDAWKRIFPELVRACWKKAADQGDC